MSSKVPLAEDNIRDDSRAAHRPSPRGSSSGGRGDGGAAGAAGDATRRRGGTGDGGGNSLERHSKEGASRGGQQAGRVPGGGRGMVLLKRDDRPVRGESIGVDMRASGGRSSSSKPNDATATRDIATPAPDTKNIVSPVSNGVSVSHLDNTTTSSLSAGAAEALRLYRVVKETHKRCRLHLDATRADAQKTQELCMYGVRSSASALGIDLRSLNGLSNTLMDEVSDLLKSSDASLLHLVADSIAMVSSVHVEVLQIFSSVAENFSTRATATQEDTYKAMISETVAAETEALAAWASGVIERLMGMMTALEGISAAVSSIESQDGYISNKESLLAAIQTVFIALGDTMKAKAAGSADRNFTSFAALYYYQACRVKAPSGSLRKRIAGLHLGDVWESTSLLGLSLISVHKPSTSKDHFLNALDRQRIAASKLIKSDASSYLSPSERSERFMISLQACLSTVLSRADVSQFDNNLQNMKKHLSSFISMRTSEVSNRYADNESSCNLALESGSLRPLENIVMHGLCLILATAELLSRKHNLDKSVEKDDTSLEVSSDDNANRSAFRWLNDIRVTPGLIDMGRIVTGFMLAISGGSGLGLYSSARDTKSSIQDILRFQLTLPVISVFLEWFNESGVYRLIPMLDGPAWEQLESGLRSYAGALRVAISSHRLKLSVDVPQENQLLPEDFWLRGISPLNTAKEHRFHSLQSLTVFDQRFCFDLVADVTDNSLSTYLKVTQTKLGISSNTDLFLMRWHRCAFLSDILATTAMQVRLKRDKIATGESKSGNGFIVVAFDGELKLTYSSESTRKIFTSSPFANKFASVINASASKEPAVAAIRLPGFASGCSFSGQIASADPEAQADELNTHDDDNDDELFAMLNQAVIDTAKSSSDTAQKAPGMFKIDPTVFDLSSKRAQDQEQIRRTQEELEREEAAAAISSSRRDRSGGGASSRQLPLIVLDVPNIAMRHGLNAKFSCKGVKIAFDFFLHLGHRVIGFLPDYYLNMERIGELRRAAHSGVKSSRAAVLPDDISLLQQLAERGFIITTPPQDYDDSYCISYARSHDAYLVTNDLYRDHVAKVTNPTIKEKTRAWLKAHCISYTFVHDEFVPNPDTKFN